jgi:hypothetical protein
MGAPLRPPVDDLIAAFLATWGWAAAGTLAERSRLLIYRSQPRGNVVT